MTAIKMAKMEINRFPWLMDKTNTWYLAKNPEVGGIPASDMSSMVINTAIQGFSLKSPLKIESSSCPSDARFTNMNIMNNGTVASE